MKLSITAWKKPKLAGCSQLAKKLNIAPTRTNPATCSCQRRTRTRVDDLTVLLRYLSLRNYDNYEFVFAFHSTAICYLRPPNVFFSQNADLRFTIRGFHPGDPQLWITWCMPSVEWAVEKQAKAQKNMIPARENGRLSVRSLDWTQSKPSLHLLRNNEGCGEHLDCRKSRTFRLSLR